MNRTIIFIIFFVFSSCAEASWIKIEWYPIDSSNNYYFEDDSKIISDNFVKIWILNDYSYAQVNFGVIYRSAKIHVEVDCGRKMLRTFNIIWYSENMGKGKVVRTFPNSSISSWHYISPDTLDAALSGVACASR